MIRVYIVDDSTIVTNLISKHLVGKGYTVEISNSPVGAVNNIKEFRPQVVLMDLGLPGMSGEKLIEMVREKNHGADCRIILFSSADDKEMKDLVERGVAHDFFIKGGPLKELENKILSQACTILGPDHPLCRPSLS